MRIENTRSLHNAVAEDEVTITPAEAEAIIKYCKVIGVKLQKRESTIAPPMLQHGQEKRRFLNSSLGNVIYTCAKVCDALITREQLLPQPDAEYIKRIEEEKQLLISAWEKITGMGIETI